ncbi:MAG: hypothetical protein DU489_10990 [Nitrosomonas sp.]|uniref:hypothetical protein n=1 Tax=Nitrosomonas sp. TaxID=42353 RepID=UPI0032EFFD09
MTVDALRIESIRLLALLKIVRREGALLQKTDARLFTVELDAAWVERLENDDDLAERLDAFVSRFGRMQDTAGDKLIPALLRSMAEKTGSALDNLNRAEKLGLLPSVEQWLDARNLRNKLVHEYMSDPEEFASALNTAHLTVPLLVTTYNAINHYARSRLSNAEWPELLP